MPEYNSREMARRGRIGALVTASRHDVRELTAPARAAFRQQFVDAVDPERILDPEERGRRAEALRRAHYAKLAHASVLARSRRGSPAPEAA